MQFAHRAADTTEIMTCVGPWNMLQSVPSWRRRVGHQFCHVTRVAKQHTTDTHWGLTLNDPSEAQTHTDHNSREDPRESKKGRNVGREREKKQATASWSPWFEERTKSGQEFTPSSGDLPSLLSCASATVLILIKKLPDTVIRMFPPQ